MSAGTVRIGTRGSTLALWQARWVADRLRAELPDRDIELVPVTTRGDVHAGPLTGSAGEIGFFTSEIEAALIDGRVDLAVHSLKDLPTADQARLPVVAVPLRHDPADVLVGRDGLTLERLPRSARVGTSSPRRTCLVRSRRPDLEIAPLRGNVDTRVKKVEAGEYDAIVLAMAGVARLGLERVVTERFDPAAFPPAPGQGALAVQVGETGGAVAEALARLDDEAARSATAAERACLQELGGGCARPIGAYARAVAAGLELTAFVGAEDGSRVVRAVGTGADPETVGRAVAAELFERGAGDLLP
ncbi:MAG: hydroxymethylbilane synthase [Gemmatimonadota bacterium]